MGHAHGIKWTDELVKEKILECVKNLRLNRMPSKSEIIKYYGNYALASKLSKTTGIKAWAEKLRLDIKESETSKGFDYEMFINNLLKEKGYKTMLTNSREHFDILVNDKVKIDVKFGSKWYIDTYECNSLCIALDSNQNIEKILIIPSYEVRCRTMTIGKHSKYDKWIDRYDVIDKYLKCFEEISLDFETKAR